MKMAHDERIAQKQSSEYKLQHKARDEQKKTSGHSESQHFSGMLNSPMRLLLRQWQSVQYEQRGLDFDLSVDL